MSKLKLLILDANVVIFLHDAGIWSRFVAVCDVHLPRTVTDEAAFYDDEDSERHYIDLSEDVSHGRVNIFDVSLVDLQKFQQRFDQFYVREIDPGELEALAFLYESEEEFTISSGDAIVYRVLGRLGKGDQGISLEEILPRVGLGVPTIAWQYTKKFREKYTHDGFTDMMQNRGLKK